AESVPECLAAILHDEPDWTFLPRSAPASVRRLLRRCLEKDSERRIRAATDVRQEIRTALQKPGRRLPARSASPRASPRLAQLTLARGLEESPAFGPGGELAYAAD